MNNDNLNNKRPGDASPMGPNIEELHGLRLGAKPKQRLVWMAVILLLIVAATQMCCRTRGPCGQGGKPSLGEDYDNTHQLLNDIFSRAQSASVANPSLRIRTKNDIEKCYPDLLFKNGRISKGNYELSFDFTWSGNQSASNLLPPLVAIPSRLMAKYPDRAFPVLLLRPEDNPSGALFCKIRLHFLGSVDVNNFASKNFDYAALLENYSFLTKYSSNYWPYYSQARTEEFFSAWSDE